MGCDSREWWVKTKDYTFDMVSIGGFTWLHSLVHSFHHPLTYYDTSIPPNRAEWNKTKYTVDPWRWFLVETNEDNNSYLNDTSYCLLTSCKKLETWPLSENIENPYIFHLALSLRFFLDRNSYSNDTYHCHLLSNGLELETFNKYFLRKLSKSPSFDTFIPHNPRTKFFPRAWQHTQIMPSIVLYIMAKTSIFDTSSPLLSWLRFFSEMILY